MNVIAKVRQLRYWGRLSEILKVLARYGLADWIKEIPIEEVRQFATSSGGEAIAGMTQPVRVRLALTELGTTFIKLGQVLSTRSDLVGPAMAEELGKLQASTPPEPAEIVRATIEAELGQPVEQLFCDFEPEAFASASIGQVHRARLPDGKAVVIKVQHAGIESKVHDDLELMMLLAELLQEYVASVRPYQPQATVRQFRRTLLRELDFTSERRNAQEFTRNFAKDDTVHFPVVYPERSSRRVLTMEFLSGIPGSSPAELRASGTNLSDFASRAADVYLKMIFRDGFYHADPHPGNYLLLPGGVVGVLDCGMVGRIDDELRANFEEFLITFSQRDSQGVSELLLRIGSTPPDIDRKGFQTEVSDFLEEYGSVSIKDFDLGGALEQMLSIVRRYRVILPASVSLLIKVLIMLEGTAVELDPEFSLGELLDGYESQIVKRRLSPERWLRKFQRAYRDWDRLITTAPRDLADILESVRQGRLIIQHEHHGLEGAVDRVVQGMLASALFLGASLLASKQIPPLLWGFSFPGLLGYLLAFLLGTGLAVRLGRNKG